MRTPLHLPLAAFACALATPMLGAQTTYEITTSGSFTSQNGNGVAGISVGDSFVHRLVIDDSFTSLEDHGKGLELHPTIVSSEFLVAGVPFSRPAPTVLFLRGDHDPGPLSGTVPASFNYFEEGVLAAPQFNGRFPSAPSPVGTTPEFEDFLLLDQLMLSSSALLLRGNDLGGDIVQGRATVSVVELTDTTPPTAAADDESVTAGATVQLDGTASYDDTTATEDLLYAWTLTSTPAGSASALDDAASATPSFVADQPGTYTLDLVVTDEAGLVSLPHVVTVSSLNLAPTADPGSEQAVLVNATATLDGLGSSDPDGHPLTYAWTLVGAPVGSTAILVDDTSAIASLTPDVAGDYVVELVVNDGFVSSAPSQVEITAADAGTARDIVRDAMDTVRGLPVSHFAARGHKRAFLAQMRSVVRSILKGDIDRAESLVANKILPRVDGVTERGTPDPMGWDKNFRADWIVDPVSQVAVHDKLVAALAILQQL